MIKHIDFVFLVWVCTVASCCVYEEQVSCIHEGDFTSGILSKTINGQTFILKDSGFEQTIMSDIRVNGTLYRVIKRLNYDEYEPETGGCPGCCMFTLKDSFSFPMKKIIEEIWKLDQHVDGKPVLFKNKQNDTYQTYTLENIGIPFDLGSNCKSVTIDQSGYKICTGHTERLYFINQISRIITVKNLNRNIGEDHFLKSYTNNENSIDLYVTDGNYFKKASSVELKNYKLKDGFVDDKTTFINRLLLSNYERIQYYETLPVLTFYY